MGDTKILNFSGYDWQVRPDETGNPGPDIPNNWRSNNVWVDEDGLLHLKITQENGKWYCAEIHTIKNLGFGKYQFHVIGRIDRFDPNIVLGLFNFEEGAPKNGKNEIDIEIARWGNSGDTNGQFKVWPSDPSVPQLPDCKELPDCLPDCEDTYKFSFSLNGTYTTHRFVWTSEKVDFQSLHDHTNNNEFQIEAWSYQRDVSSKRIPQQPLRVHINLWLYDGKPPTDEKEVEVIIKNFQFTPAS
jgi:hypothetical protein